MSDSWFKRVTTEYAELGEKVDKLHAHLQSKEEADGLLVVQFYAMLQYKAALLMRIEQGKQRQIEEGEEE